MPTLNRPQRWLAVTALATAWAITEDSLLLLLMLVAAARALFDNPATAPIAAPWSTTSPLVAALSLLAFSHRHCDFGEAINSARAGRSFRLASSSSIPELALFFQQKTKAAGRYSLCDNGLSVKDIGFVWRFFGARRARAVSFPADAGSAGQRRPSSRVAPTVATLRFHKVCAFVTISSNRPCLSSSKRAARLHRATPFPFVVQARGPESLSGLSKSDRRVRTS